MKLRKLFQPKNPEPTFQVHAGGVHPDGTKIEPEEQLVKVTQEITNQTTKGGKPTGKNIPVEVTRFLSAADFANAQGRMCGNCKHMDRAMWIRTVRRIESSGSQEELQGLNDMRAEILAKSATPEIIAMQNDDDDDIDLEHILKSMGFCHALEEHYKDGHEVMVFPTSSCPLDVVTPTEPHGFFKPVDRTAEKASSRNRDTIMKRATGKIE